MSRFEIRLPSDPYEEWSQEAVDGLVGQSVTFEGSPATVVSARLANGAAYATIDAPDLTEPESQQ